MLLAIAALLAVTSPRGAELASQAQPVSTRTLEAVRIVEADAAGSEGESPMPSLLVPAVPTAEGTRSGWYSLSGGTHFGLLVDGGVPGGAGLAGMFRPWSFLRLEGGLNWNYLSFGLRGGLTLIPFEWGLTPTLHLEGGHFFPADAGRFTSSGGAKVLLGHVPEDYLSASLGLEFGSQQRFVFFLRLGLCWIRTEAQNIAQAIAAENPGSTTKVKSAGNIPILVQAPTVSAGVLFFLF